MSAPKVTELDQMLADWRLWKARARIAAVPYIVGLLVGALIGYAIGVRV